MMESHTAHRICEQFFILVCIVMAIVSASVAAIVLRIDGLELPHSWSMAGVGLAAAGVSASLGIFLFQDLNRQDADEDIKAELSEIRKELKKLQCMCQAERCNEVIAQDGQRRSWLFGLFFGGARR